MNSKRYIKTGKKQNKNNKIKVIDIDFDQFDLKDRVKSNETRNKFCPGIFKNEDGNCYVIRILRQDLRKVKSSIYLFDYFELDRTGLIISSPCGMAHKYNGRIRIKDIDLIARQYLEGKI